MFYQENIRCYHILNILRYYNHAKFKRLILYSIAKQIAEMRHLNTRIGCNMTHNNDIQSLDKYGSISADKIVNVHWLDWLDE